MKILSLAVIAGAISSAFARSSVYLVSQHQHDSTTAEAAEISLNSFGQLYSHLLNTAASVSQSGLKLQDNRQSEFENVYSLWSNNNPASDLFQRKLNGNLMIVVDGVESPQDIFNKEASFYVTEDEGDRFADISQRSMDEIVDNKDQGIVSTFDGKSETLVGSVLPLEDTFVTRYQTNALDSNNEVDKKFMDQVDVTEQMVLLLKESQGIKSKIDLELIELNGLQLIIDEYGVQSEQYKEATRVLKQLFENTVIPTFLEAYSSDRPALSTFIFTPPKTMSSAHHLNKRGPSPIQIQDAKCFASEEVCNNSTSGCSGQGTCSKVSAKCYSCVCSAQRVGDACQYVDAVGDFQLLFWTGVFLIVTTAGVLTFVYKSGNIDNGGIIMSAQPLPKQD